MKSISIEELAWLIRDDEFRGAAKFSGAVTASPVQDLRTNFFSAYGRFDLVKIFFLIKSVTL